MVLQEFKKPLLSPKLRETHLVRATPIDDPSKKRGIAIIVSNHDAWIQALEVENQQGTVVEGTLRFHHQWQTLQSILPSDLLSAGGDEEEVLWLCNPEHERFYFELGSAREDREEIDTKKACLLARPWDQLILLEYLQVELHP
jgi:hypothetical protein